MQIKESLKICQCVVVVAVVAMVQVKESFKICQCVEVVAVRKKESLKIYQCSSSRSYSANKRVVQNLSDCKTLLFAILLPHSEKKECDNGTTNKRVIQNLSGCCSSSENKRVVPNPSECSSGSANKRVVQNLSVL